MDKEYRELVNRMKELNSEISKLDRNIYPIRYFVSERGKFFKNDDSIKALSIIQGDISKIEQLIDKKNEERNEISEALISNCNHPIIINKVCPICGKWFYQVLDDASIVLEIPNMSNHVLIQALFTNVNHTYKNEYLNKIIEIIKSALLEEDTLLYFEDAVEELQYDKNVKIRRLKK
jgi:hypothetical protein